MMAAFTVWASGMLVARGLDYRIPILSGFALAAIGLGLLSTFDGDTSTAKMVGYMLITGLGFGSTFQKWVCPRPTRRWRLTVAAAP